MNKQKRIYIYSTQELLLVLEAWHINADLSREIATYVRPTADTATVTELGFRALAGDVHVDPRFILTPKIDVTRHC